MYQITPVVGASADQFVLVRPDAPKLPLRVRVRGEDERVLVFDSEADTRAYLSDPDVPAAIRATRRPARLADASATPLDRHALIHVGPPSGEPRLHLTCPRCDSSGFEDAFEDLPAGEIGCRSCGAKADAARFTPRLLRGSAAIPRAPAERALSLRVSRERARTWVVTPARGDEARERGLWLLSPDRNFSHLKMTDGAGSLWPAAFQSPVDAWNLVDNLRRAAETTGVDPGVYDAFRAVRAANCGLLDDKTYVLEVSHAMRECPRCGRLSDECDATTNKFVCARCDDGES